MNDFGCYPLEIETTPKLQFTIRLQSNDLIPEQRYKVRQEIMYKIIKDLKESGLGYRKISKKLNSWGIKTERGNEWLPQSVFSVLKRKKQRRERIQSQRNEYFPLEMSPMEIKYYRID